MIPLKFSIDADAIASTFGELKAEVQRALERGVKNLAAQTHAKVVELASSNLGNATRRIYMNNLDFQEIAKNVWVVSLDKPALWIEEGRKSGDQTEDLLRYGAKISKDGHRYKAIPFDHGKPSSEMNNFGKEMLTLIKKTLKQEGKSIKKIEVDKNGSPRLGKLATYHIDSPLPTSRANTPALFGLNVYQSKMKNGKVRRDIMTFRMVSDKHKGSKWIHPGREASKFFEKALEYANTTWETEVLPAILEDFK